MTKKKEATNDNVVGSGDTTPKRQHGKVPYFSRLFPFLGELKTYAEERYKEARFDQATPDTELEKRNELRRVLADFPVKE